MINAKISGFYDEVNPKLDEQIAMMKKLGENYLCPRILDEKSINDFTLEEFKSKIYPRLKENNIKFSSIGSGIGKIDINDEEAYEKQLKQLKELVGICKLMECKYVRIFSFFGCLEAPEKNHATVIKKLRGFLEVVKGTGVILLHENEKEIYGDTTERVLKIYNELKDEGLQLIYDASNFIQCDCDPFDAYEQLKEYVVYYHIKDCDKISKKEVPVGLGDGRYKDIFVDLAKRNYEGFMTMEPHTAKYAFYRIPFYLVSWMWFVDVIKKTCTTYKKVDKALGKKMFQIVTKKEVFERQYINLTKLINEVN